MIIQITETITAVVVPGDASGIDIGYSEIHNVSTLYYMDKNKNTMPYSFKNFDGNWKIIGTATLPDLQFDFEVKGNWVEMPKGLTLPSLGVYLDTKNSLFRTQIQKAIQNAGLLLVNPYKKPHDYDFRNSPDVSAEEQNKLISEIEQWQQSEAKVIKGNLLIIQKN